jgi:hypothetical protein
MRKARPRPGAVVQIALPNGKYAYGRIYEDAGIGIYRQLSDVPKKPPLGSHDFQFIVGVYNDVLTSGKCLIIGEDPFIKGEDPWPPPRSIIDPISGACSIYHHGKIRSALPEECDGLEIAAVWHLDHIVDRIIHGTESRFLKSMGHRPKPKNSLH